MQIKYWAFKIIRVLTIALISFLFLAIIGGIGYLAIFNSVPSEPTGPIAMPDLQEITLNQWGNIHTPVLKQLFADEIYGIYPDTSQPLQVVTRTILDDNLLDGKAVLEELVLSNDQVETLHLVIISPSTISRTMPVIIGQNFCGNHNTFPFPGVSKPSGFYHASMCDQSGMGWLANIIMGKHLSVPPLEKIIDQGYTFAGFYPGEVAPDHGGYAPAFLEKVGTQGTVMAWAWGFNRVAEFLSTDPRFDSEKVAAFGHSRHGKASLVSAVFEDQINLVISHQSGTGGASLGKSGIGESIDSITGQYGHWFHPNYRKYADDPTTLPVDQHQLIALAAPTPIILGNGQWDKWSDPQTAQRALEGAEPIYKLYNAETNLRFHMRLGPHGTRVSDWKAFLDFLEKHF